MTSACECHCSRGNSLQLGSSLNICQKPQEDAILSRLTILWALYLTISLLPTIYLFSLSLRPLYHLYTTPTHAYSLHLSNLILSRALKFSFPIRLLWLVHSTFQLNFQLWWIHKLHELQPCNMSLNKILVHRCICAKWLQNPSSPPLPTVPICLYCPVISHMQHIHIWQKEFCVHLPTAINVRLSRDSRVL